MRNLGSNHIIVANLVYKGLANTKLYSIDSEAERRISQKLTVPLFRSCARLKIEIREIMNQPKI
jgi:hypothetical protein